jgi:hypothetical protein
MNTLYYLVLRKMGYKNPCIMYGVRVAVSVSLSFRFTVYIQTQTAVKCTEDTFHSEYEYQISYIIRMLMAC